MYNKNNLVENTYGYTNGVSDEALQALIHCLRNKGELDPRRSVYIVTVRGVGHKLVEPGEQ